MALFDLSTSAGLIVALDVLEAFLALAGSMLGLLLSRNLRGGLLQKPIQIIALSPLLIAVSQGLRALEVSQYLPESSVLLQEFVQMLLLVVLFIGFFMLYRTVESIGEVGGKV